MLWTSIVALLLSGGSLAWQGVTAYRRRRRLFVEVGQIGAAKPTGPENWIRVHVAAIGGTFSTKMLEIQFPSPPLNGGTSGPPDLGPGVPQVDARPPIEQTADPMHERRTLNDGEQVSWIRRVTGMTKNGVENEGSWVRARVTLADGRVVYSKWMWLPADNPTIGAPLPPRPKDDRTARRLP